MRYSCFIATLLASTALLAQEHTSLLLNSHDKIYGPLAGDHSEEDLTVFDDGRVIYVEDVTVPYAEDGTKLLKKKPKHSTFETTISADEMARLSGLLDSHEIRVLPKIFPVKTHPIDFFWQKSLRITRIGTTQEVQIENFYPFLNKYDPVYPPELLKLECSLQGIKRKAAKREPLKTEDDWCGEILVEREAAVCREDQTQPKIVASEGWGSVRVGADLRTVDTILGGGQAGHRYKDVHFKEYPSKGIEISFENSTNTVHAIFFYNKQRGDEWAGIFCGQTDKGITWQSSVDDVKRAYGRPTNDYSGNDSGGSWERLIFHGIDFRFENHKLVRIAVPES